MLSKVVSKEEALTKIHDGQTIMFGDWHGEFAADEIIDGMLEKGIKDIHAIAVSAGMPDQGVGKLIREKRVKSLVTTHIALNPLARDQMFAGELDIEFCPQGTWSERIRCGGAGLGGGHDEREQTLNQLLVEMDGFEANDGIIVMAAPNRIDILDPAILRPGRFDRKIVVGRPDVQGRLEILQVHAAKKPLGDDVDLEKLARTSAGFTGADLENVLNEAAIGAARKKSKYITNADVEEAFIKIGIGVEKKSKIISDKEKKITAYHESGHALLFHLLPDVGPVHTVSIIPTGAGAAGYTMPLPEKDEMFNSRGRMLQEIVVDLGGRVAEELVFDDITTGASQDIKQATKMARDMVTRYGMSENIGLICYKDDDDEVFIGRDLAHAHSYSEGIASAIDVEVKRIIDESYEKAKTIIAEHRDVLDRCAALLLEKEKITREEFEALFEA